MSRYGTIFVILAAFFWGLSGGIAGNLSFYFLSVQEGGISMPSKRDVAY